MSLLWLVVIVLLLGGFSGRWGYSRFDGNYVAGGGIGLGTIVLVVLVYWLLTGHRL